MVKARAKAVFGGAASIRFKVCPDGGLRLAVKVDREGAKALSMAIRDLVTDLSNSRMNDLVKMAREMS